MGWSYWIHDTMTGNPLIQVHPSACSGTSRLTGKGDATVTFALDGTSIPLPWQGYTTPTSRTLVKQRDRPGQDPIVQFAGYFLEPEYERDAASVTVDVKELRQLLDVRVFGAAHLVASDPGSWELRITNRSVSGAVRAILTRAIDYSLESALPVDLPADGAGSYSREFHAWDQITTADALADIEAMGYEVYLRPYKTGGKLRYQVVVAQEVTLGAVRDLPAMTPESPVVGLRVRFPGADQLTGVVAVGKGTGPDTKLRGAALNPGGIPARDSKISAKDIEDETQLQAIADAAMAEASSVTEDVSFSVRLADPVDAGWVLPGTRLRLDMTGDPGWPGVHTKRVIAVRWDMTDTVTPEVV